MKYIKRLYRKIRCLFLGHVTFTFYTGQYFVDSYDRKILVGKHMDARVCIRCKSFRYLAPKESLPEAKMLDEISSLFGDES